MRCRLTVGASSTSTPLRRASNASSRPSRSTRATSHVAASAVGDGTLADGSRSSHRLAAHAGRPVGGHDPPQARSAGSACSDQKSAPVSSRTFCSRLSARRRSSSMTRQYGWRMRALLFDVFGTCVDWRTSIMPRGRALRAAAGARRRLARPVPAAAGDRAQRQAAVGEPRRAAPDRARHRARATSDLTLPEPDRAELVTGWHRLDPWPDVVEGLTKLKADPHHRALLQRPHRPVRQPRQVREAAVGRDPRRRDRPRLQARPAGLPGERVRARPRAARGLHGRRAPRGPEPRPPTSGLQHGVRGALRRGPAGPPFDADIVAYDFVGAGGR